MKYLESKPNVASGHLVIKGTRIRIALILNFLKQGTTLQELHEWYPWISQKNLSGAIDEAIEAVSQLAHA